MTGALEVLAVTVFLGLFIGVPAACSLLMITRPAPQRERGPVRPYARAGGAGDYVRTGSLAGWGSLEPPAQFPRVRLMRSWRAGRGARG